MTLSILRTADAWWVTTAAGAVKVDTDATTTAGLLADRAAVDAAASGSAAVAVGQASRCSRRSPRRAGWWRR